MNVYVPCVFSKFAVREEPAVDGGSIAPGELLLGRHIMKAWRDYGRGTNLESGTSCYKMGRPFSEGAISHSYRIDVFNLT